MAEGVRRLPRTAPATIADARDRPASATATAAARAGCGGRARPGGPRVREAAEPFTSKPCPRGNRLLRTGAMVVGAFVRGLSMRDVESVRRRGLGTDLQVDRLPRLPRATRPRYPLRHARRWRTTFSPSARSVRCVGGPRWSGACPARRTPFRCGCAVLDVVVGHSEGAAPSPIRPPRAWGAAQGRTHPRRPPKLAAKPFRRHRHALRTGRSEFLRPGYPRESPVRRLATVRPSRA